MAFLNATYYYRREFANSLTLTSPISLGIGAIVAALLLISAAVDGNIPFNTSLAALVQSRGLLGGRYVFLLICVVYGLCAVVAAPLCRLVLVWMRLVSDASPNLYRLLALRRTLRPIYAVCFLVVCLATYIAHGGLVGISLYDTFWVQLSNVASLWPAQVGVILLSIASFAMQYLRPAPLLPHTRAVEPWTYGQVNLDVGAFGTESQEAASRLREYSRARRDKANSSSAMRTYLVRGDAREFSRVFRARRTMSIMRAGLSLAIASRKGSRRGSTSWTGLVGLRERLGRLINAAAPHSITLTSSTTSSIRLFIDSLPPGVTVLVTTDLEHPVIHHVLQRFYSERFRVETVALRHTLNRGEAAEVINAFAETARRIHRDKKRAGPKALWVFSHVEYSGGAVLPVREVTEVIRSVSSGDVVLIDGAHGPGNVEVRVDEYLADAYAFCGHKWLMGTPGSGFLWCAARHVQRLGASDFEGPASGELENRLVGQRASLAMEPFFSCDAFLEVLDSVGVRKMLEHQSNLRAQLAKDIERIDGLDVVKTRLPTSSIVGVHSSDPKSLPMADVIKHCEAAYVLAGYFPELDLGRFCVPYFLEDQSIRNVVSVIERSVRRTRHQSE